MAKTFSDIPCTAIQMNNNPFPLKYYVSVATEGVLAMGKSKEAMVIRQRIERESTFRYKVLSIEPDELINCVNVNNHLIFRHDKNENAVSLNVRG